MTISSTKLTNPLYSEKLSGYTDVAANATLSVGSWAAITGWTITLPSKAGKYRIIAQGSYQLDDNNADGDVDSSLQLYADGAPIADTEIKLEIYGTANNRGSSGFHITWEDTFSGGEVITLWGNQATAGGDVTTIRAVGSSLARLSYELVETVSPIATNVMEQYETGWVACSDWTNQLLGDTVGGNVVHNLNCDLSDIIVKVMVSTDGSDGNSFEIQTTTNPQAGLNVMGVTIYQSDNNTITVQTGSDGLLQGSIGGGSNRIDVEAWFYKIKVIKLATQYKAPAVQRYSTGWVACSDWTAQTLGDTPGGNVTHNLNEPISKLDILLLVSTDGTNANAVTVPMGDINSGNRGWNVISINDNSFKIITGDAGINIISDGVWGGGTIGQRVDVDTESWYYQVIVTKRYNTLTATVAPVMPSYDTGWVACSDWTNQALGTVVGGNVVHSLGYNLRELLVQVFISTDGTDVNSFEVVDTASDGAGNHIGIVVKQVDTNNILVQTGLTGIYSLITGTGATILIDTEAYYYRIVVTKLQPVISVRNISEDYSTSETDTGKQWIDGKTIYRKCFSGISATAAQYIVSGIVPDTVTKLEYIQETSNGTTLFAGSEYTTGGVDQCQATWCNATHATNANQIYLYHAQAALQGQQYYIIMEYTLV